jgi:predicted permease
VERIWQDVRFGLRTLVKTPGFTFVAIAALALGIGANSAIFSVVNAILLRPLAYNKPEQLVLINHFYRTINLNASVSAFGYKHYVDNAKSFSSIAALTGWAVNLTGEGEPERLAGRVVSPNFFSTLRVQPSQGRVFADGEDQEGRNRVVVLSHSFWQRRFGGDSSVLNRTITLNGLNYTVIGILPAYFQFGREMGQTADLWSPLTFTQNQLSSNSLTNEFLFVIARLKDGITMDQAQAELDTIAANLRSQYMPNADSSLWTLRVSSLRETVVGDIRESLLVLLAAVALVLLIACANVANLLLARGTSRQKEIAIRTAIGAGRGRIIRQLLTESVLLSLAGGLIGLGLGWLLVKLLVGIIEDRLPRAHEISLDPSVFAFAALISVFTGLLFGLLPALHLSRADLHGTLKEGGRASTGGARKGVRSALVVLEMALALVVLVGAGLLIKSFGRVQNINPGFRADHLITMQLSLPEQGYREPAQRVAFFQQLLERIRALPGVEAVGSTSILPLSGSNSSGSFQIEGRVIPQGQSSPHGDRWSATTDYFKTMGIRLVKGRFFEERDSAEAPGVALIDETMAAKYWPNEDPVGKRITFEGGPQNPRWREIVGIVGHVKHANLEGESRVQYYIPYYQRPQSSMYLVARSTGDPTTIAGSIRGAVATSDPNLPVFRVRTLEQYVSDSMAQRRFAMYLFGVFAIIALILAAVGLYGVMAYSVTQRTHEIGVRMALGARRADVMKLVVGNGMLLAGAGVVVGIGAAFGLTRLMATLLFNVKATDLSVFALIAVGLTGVAVAASYLPARRATKVDPMIALRYE